MPNFIINVKEKGAKKATKNIGGLNNALGGLASKAALAAGGFFGAGMLLSGMKSAIDLAGKQEAAEKALETALGGTSKALLEQASALQTISTFGDEAIIQQQVFLGSLKFSEDQIKSIIPVAMDLAAATGMTLESAVRNTAKTFSGLAGELGELVPQLRGLTKEQMMAGDAVTVMGDLFGGQAAAQTETITGKMTMFKNVLGDTAEAFGELLIPPLTFVIGALGSLAKGVEFVLDGFQSLIEPKELKLLTQADIDASNFKETLASLSAVELYRAAISMGEFAGVTELQRSNMEALSDAITNNAELQDMANLKITEMNVIHGGITIPQLKKVAEGEMTIAEAIKIAKAEREKATIAELKGYALTSGSAKDAMKNVVKAESMEAVAGLISSILKNVPFPLSAVLAAGAGASVSTLIDKGLASFATGADFVTSGPQMMMVGDNPGGREQVSVTPLSSPNIDGPQGGGSNITLNISAPLVDDTVVDHIIPAIRDALRRGESLEYN